MAQLGEYRAQRAASLPAPIVAILRVERPCAGPWMRGLELAQPPKHPTCVGGRAKKCVSSLASEKSSGYEKLHQNWQSAIAENRSQYLLVCVFCLAYFAVGYLALAVCRPTDA